MDAKTPDQSEPVYSYSAPSDSGVESDVEEQDRDAAKPSKVQTKPGDEQQKQQKRSKANQPQSEEQQSKAERSEAKQTFKVAVRTCSNISPQTHPTQPNPIQSNPRPVRREL